MSDDVLEAIQRRREGLRAVRPTVVDEMAIYQGKLDDIDAELERLARAEQLLSGDGDGSPPSPSPELKPNDDDPPPPAQHQPSQAPAEAASSELSSPPPLALHGPDGRKLRPNRSRRPRTDYGCSIGWATTPTFTPGRCSSTSSSGPRVSRRLSCAPR